MPIGLGLNNLVYRRDRNNDTEQDIGDVGEYVEVYSVRVQSRIYNDQIRADVVVDCKSQKSALDTMEAYCGLLIQ